MTRRDMAIQATLVFSLVSGIVGGNFLLHRWVIGNTASREVGAGTMSDNLPDDDLEEFAPRSRRMSRSAPSDDPGAERELLRRLIAEKLPQASIEEREAWLEELSDVSLTAAEGILDLRDQLRQLREVGPQQSLDESARDSKIPATE